MLFRCLIRSVLHPGSASIWARWYFFAVIPRSRHTSPARRRQHAHRVRQIMQTDLGPSRSIPTNAPLVGPVRQRHTRDPGTDTWMVLWANGTDIQRNVRPKRKKKPLPNVEYLTSAILIRFARLLQTSASCRFFKKTVSGYLQTARAAGGNRHGRSSLAQPEVWKNREYCIKNVNRAYSFEGMSHAKLSKMCFRQEGKEWKSLGPTAVPV
jgi:hypothetical protein